MMLLGRLKSTHKHFHLIYFKLYHLSVKNSRTVLETAENNVQKKMQSRSMFDLSVFADNELLQLAKNKLRNERTNPNDSFLDVTFRQNAQILCKNELRIFIQN